MTTHQFKHLPIFDKTGFQKHIETLNDEQMLFVKQLEEYFANPEHNTLIIVTGEAGTGKTYAVIETLNHLTCKTIRMAYSRKAAENIGGYTIHSTFRIDFSENSNFKRIMDSLKIKRFQLSEKDYMKYCSEAAKELIKEFRLNDKFRYSINSVRVIVIDEISNICDVFFLAIMEFILELFRGKKILCVGMGDHNQLAPIECPYNIFNQLVLPTGIKIHTINLINNKRFTNEYRLIMETLQTFVKNNDLVQAIPFLRQQYCLLPYVTQQDVGACNMVLTYTNKSVLRYNEEYLRQFPGDLYKIPCLEVNGKPLFVKTNCRLMMTKNMRELANGTELEFLGYDAYNDKLYVKARKTSRLYNIPRDPLQGQFPVTLGFAVTIHKYQGETLEEKKILFDFDRSTDLKLMYTALSRVRSMDQVYGITNLCDIPKDDDES